MRILRLLREEKGLTQDELAIRLNVTRSYLSLIENEKKTASTDLLIKICDEFRISPCVILCSRFKGQFPICQLCSFNNSKHLSDDERLKKIKSARLKLAMYTKEGEFVAIQHKLQE